MCEHDVQLRHDHLAECGYGDKPEKTSMLRTDFKLFC
jgi:hypothetical protein